LEEKTGRQNSTGTVAGAKSYFPSFFLLFSEVFASMSQSLNWNSWVQEENSREATEVIEVI
jgi:hypothetical protein